MEQHLTGTAVCGSYSGIRVSGASRQTLAFTHTHTCHIALRPAAHTDTRVWRTDEHRVEENPLRRRRPISRESVGKACGSFGSPCSRA